MFSTYFISFLLKNSKSFPIFPHCLEVWNCTTIAHLCSTVRKYGSR